MVTFTNQPESGCAVINNGIRLTENSSLAKSGMHGGPHSLALTRQRVSDRGEETVRKLKIRQTEPQNIEADNVNGNKMM